MLAISDKLPSQAIPTCPQLLGSCLSRRELYSAAPPVKPGLLPLRGAKKKKMTGLGTRGRR